MQCAEAGGRLTAATALLSAALNGRSLHSNAPFLHAVLVRGSDHSVMGQMCL